MARFRLLGLAAVTALTACAGTPNQAAAPAAVPVVSQATCVPLVLYTKAQNAELLKEFHALGPKQTMLYQVVIDYLAMRDADRACLGPKNPSPRGPHSTQY